MIFAALLTTRLLRASASSPSSAMIFAARLNLLTAARLRLSVIRVACSAAPPARHRLLVGVACSADCCSPSAALLLLGCRPLRPSPAVQPVQALISYIELVRSTVTRQKTLKEQYLFTCTCPRCIKVGQYNEDDAYLDGYQCTSNERDGFFLCDSDDNGFICQQCGQFKSKEEIREMESEIKSLQEKTLIAEQSACSYVTYQEVVAMYKSIETLQRTLFNPCCIYFVQTWEAILEYSVKLKDWREAVKYCKLAIALYQKIYPGYHPPLGLQYYGCGKFEGYLGEAENAVKSLTRAVDILKITYGTSTPFMKKLCSILEEQRVELEEQRVVDTQQ